MTSRQTTINGFDLAQERETMEAMRQQPEAGAITIRTRHRWQSAAAIDGSSEEIAMADGPIERDHHHFRTDFPREMGGTDAGPAPGEMLLAALAAATSTMRRALQEGQTPRPLQEKATRRSAPQSPQRARAKPWARMPQAR